MGILHGTMGILHGTMGILLVFSAARCYPQLSELSTIKGTP